MLAVGQLPWDAGSLSETETKRNYREMKWTFKIKEEREKQKDKDVGKEMKKRDRKRSREIKGGGREKWRKRNTDKETRRNLLGSRRLF